MIDGLLRDTFARHEELVPAAPPGLRAAILTGARRRRVRRRWAWTGLLTGVLVIVALLAVPVTALPGQTAHRQVAAPSAPMHLLLVGIDHAGEEPAAQVRADAMVLVHIDPAARTAYAVMVPRDLMLNLPGLGRQRADGAYLVGGYRRAADAMARLTGVPLDGGVVVDIAAMESITGAAGGVDLCVERRIQSRHLAYDGQGGVAEPAYGRAPVVYEPGCRHYDAREAVDYLREAAGAGDERGLRQYLTAMAVAASDPVRLPALLAAAGAGVELHLGAGSLAGLAGTLRGIDPGRVSGVRLPSTPSDTGQEPLPDGDGLYDALRAGRVGSWLAAHPQYAA
ncbi:LCP family protein [Dactylosporangium sp. NPDC048998]|uniref:LCP family protein n=1 Tax=Dactylosporangium sp. NPDC048998 TaxID=3363976 RepID=UPI0037248CA5